MGTNQNESKAMYYIVEPDVVETHIRYLGTVYGQDAAQVHGGALLAKMRAVQAPAEENEKKEEEPEQQKEEKKITLDELTIYNTIDFLRQNGWKAKRRVSDHFEFSLLLPEPLKHINIPHELTLCGNRRFLYVVDVLKGGSAAYAHSVTKWVKDLYGNMQTYDGNKSTPEEKATEINETPTNEQILKYLDEKHWGKFIKRERGNYIKIIYLHSDDDESGKIMSQFFLGKTGSMKKTKWVKKREFVKKRIGIDLIDALNVPPEGNGGPVERSKSNA